MSKWIRTACALVLLTLASAGWAQEWNALTDAQREALARYEQSWGDIDDARRE